MLLRVDLQSRLACRQLEIVVNLRLRSPVFRSHTTIKTNPKPDLTSASIEYPQAVRWLVAEPGLSAGGRGDGLSRLSVAGR